MRVRTGPFNYVLKTSFLGKNYPLGFSVDSIENQIVTILTFGIIFKISSNIVNINVKRVVQDFEPESPDSAQERHTYGPPSGV